MKVAVLGAGAMGMLFGAYLSQSADVMLIDSDLKRVEAINRNGIHVQEKDGANTVYYPVAVTRTDGTEPVDLVIVFVKAMYSHDALKQIRNFIGSQTQILSLQNGSGHENVLSQYAPLERIILGATQHNSSLTGISSVFHGGSGNTYLGLISGEIAPLQKVAALFKAGGFSISLSENIRKHIWEKLFLNVSGSALTAILQVKLGYLINDAHAWFLVERLTREAVAVANAIGLDFVADDIVASNRNTLERAKDGVTSICADIRDGRITEVDTISGSLVRVAKEAGVPVPTHECVVALIHALENRPK